MCEWEEENRDLTRRKEVFFLIVLIQLLEIEELKLESFPNAEPCGAPFKQIRVFINPFFLFCFCWVWTPLTRSDPVVCFCFLVLFFINFLSICSIWAQPILNLLTLTTIFPAVPPSSIFVFYFIFLLLNFIFYLIQKQKW